jgi:hypothetical protein
MAEERVNVVCSHLGMDVHGRLDLERSVTCTLLVHFKPLGVGYEVNTRPQLWEGCSEKIDSSTCMQKPVQGDYHAHRTIRRNI